MATSKAKLEIVAGVKDVVSGPMRKIARSFRTTFVVGAKAVGKFRKAFGGLQGVIAGVIGGAVVGKAVSTFKDLTKGLNDVADAAVQTNSSASSFLTLRDAVAESGVEFGALSAAVRTFEKNVGDARQGASTQIATLRRLGLSTSDFAGANKNAVETLAKVADGLATVDDASIRTNLALKLFGEDTGAALLPVLAKGGDALREFATEQAELGRVISSDGINATVEYETEIAKLSTTFKKLGEGVAVGVAPQLTSLFKDLRNIIDREGPAIRDALQSIVSGLVVAFGGVIKIIGLLRKSFLGLEAIAIGAELAWAKITGDRGGAIKAEREIRKLNAAIAENDRLTDELSSKFVALNKTLEKGFKTPQRITVTGDRPADEPKQVETAWDKFWSGFDQNVEVAKGKWTDFRTAGLDAATTIVDGGLQHLTNAFASIIDGTKSAKEAWKDFAKAMLADLAKIIAKQITLNIVQGFVSATAEKGAVFPGNVTKTVPLRRFESGGVVRRPTMALFGEGKASKGEAFVPLPDGRRIPVNLTNGGGSTNVNITVQAWDGRDAQRALYEQRGTLRALWQSDLSRVQAVRQNVRSVVS